MRTTVVCGMLGSGKTTFIQQFLRESAEKTVVLVNDFGRVGIDGEIFSAGGIESVELPSGCVCCTLKFDLITTINKVIDQFSPSHLVIEPSGVASPSGVIEILDLLKLNQTVIYGIVDAAEFVELYESGMYGSFFTDQMVNSDVVLVNKIDLAPELDVDRTVGIIEAMNPRALVFRTVRAGIGPAHVKAPQNRTILKGGSHFHFDTVSFRLKEAWALPMLEKVFAELSEGKYGDVVRAKALVMTDKGPYRADLSFGKTDIVPFGREITESRVVIIGEKLRADAISGCFQ